MRLLTFWRDLDDDDKAGLIKGAGVVVAVFTLFTLLSIVSYFFTWKADQSLMEGPLRDPTVDVANFCGGPGFRWADLLVRRWFGLGSLAMIVILFAVSARLLLNRWHHSMLKTLLLTVSGAMLSSFMLAFLSRMAGLGNSLGGGLGGEWGAAAIGWSIDLFKGFMTLIFLLVFIGLWLYFASPKFSHWFSSLGAKTGKEGKDERKPELENTEEEDIGMHPAPVKSEAAPLRNIVQKSESASKPESISNPRPVGNPGSASKSGLEDKPEQPSLEVIKGAVLSTDITKELPRINVRDELSKYEFPSLELLESHASNRHEVTDDEINRNNNRIRETLENYKIKINDVKAIVGPTVTLYKVYPAPGVKISEIRKLQDDIGMNLRARGVRVVTLTDSVGIEVANDRPSIVPMRAVLNDDAFRQSKAELPVAIGYTIQQKVKVFDLAEAPHLLVAGATKQGKSVGLNAIVASLLYSKHPSELKMVFIDPKMVEFSAYARLLKHYMAVLPCNDEKEEVENAIVKKADRADKVLKSLCIEMDKRYELLSKALVPNIKLYNEKYRNRHLLPTEGHTFLPYIVTVIDEYADLTMSVGGSGEARTVARSITTSIIRLAQKGRAAGIHVVLATQRPSVDVITGLIKTNFPTRIAFRVVSRTDSATILDSPGAEKLIGKGDMLYYAGVETERVQCAYIDPEEINKLTAFIGDQVGYKKSYGTPYYLPDVEEGSEDEGGGLVDMKNLDERFEEAARLVVTSQRGSTSDLQRRLGMGYAKAGRVMDQLEAAGVVGHQEGSKPRQVLISSLEELEKVIQAFRNQ